LVRIGSSIVRFSVDHPRFVTGVLTAAVVCLTVVAALPSVWPETFTALNPLKVDTDPENMLPKDEPVRVFHDKMKKAFSLYDMVVVGVVNEGHPDGVFNPESLGNILELTEYAKTLRWPDAKNSGEQVGVVSVDILAPSTVDNIEQAGLGTVKFEWLMASPPRTAEEARAIRKKAERIPFLNGTLLSEDGKALALYLPLTSKDVSYKVYSKLRARIATLSGDEEYFITGLPVAEDTFGVEMFKQMAISAPIAMVVIFLLMLFFFRKLVLVLSPMIVAMISVICTMALLVATGHTVHIMSSMIPIFIMPIAVLDAVHILSEFFDRYQETRDRRTTILNVMDSLFTPMFYTSVTTAVGFASLAMTPIPPVRIFGLFVALGVMVAWISTITFIPAYVMFVPQRALRNFGAARTESGHDRALRSPMARLLAATGRLTFRHAKTILMLVGVLVIVAAYGMSRIEINDNPTRWFTPSHPIRVADRVLNKHFGGTYMAYLALESEEEGESPERYAESLPTRIDARVQELEGTVESAGQVFETFRAEATRLSRTASSRGDLLESLQSFANGKLDDAPPEESDAWYEAVLFVDQERQREQVFKQPEVLRYIASIQQRLLATRVVGKSNSLADIVKTVYRELVSGRPEDLKIPDSANAVGQSLITFQNGHRPDDLWHFVTPDYKKTVVWAQLKSGDNRDMSKVVRAVDEYMKAFPPPVPLEHKWFGLTYINVVWQNKMVSGMLRAFLGSFIIVFLMMTLLYRSALWGILCMIPLTVTIAAIYGVIGLVGKDYDMPVAILSSLSLGLAVDYSIHFLTRSRALYQRYGSWTQSVGPAFGEPARAIARNVIVVGVGFLPLLLAPLVPYQTVGLFIASILITAGAATLLILPSLMRVLEGWLFPQTAARALTCRCGTYVTTAVAVLALVVINLYRYLAMGWTTLSLIGLGVIVAAAALCRVVSRCEQSLPQESPVKKGEAQ
jgi:predicted RND superfamily exporter protein